MKPGLTTPIIHHTAIVYPGVQLGDNVYIGPYCTIGSRAEINSPAWGSLPEGRVIIDTGTVLTGHVTIDSGQDEYTVIGENCFIMKGAHVGHDCDIGDGVVMSPGVVIAGEVEIGNDCNMGMNATVHQQIKIPAKCMIGQGAVITRKRAATMKACQTWAGNPARLIGPNKKWLKA